MSHVLLERICAYNPCGRLFLAQQGNIERGWGQFCSHRCAGLSKGRIQLTCRRLRPSESLPTSTPRRYKTRDGYIVLRWKIGPATYVEALEHRLIAGLDSEHVHHKNHDKTDNGPLNIEPMSASEHSRLHHPRQFDVSEAAILHQSGWTWTALGKKFGVHPVTVMRAVAKQVAA